MYNTYLNSFHDLQAKSNKFQQRLQEQRDEDGFLFSEAAALLNKANDAAFEGLETLVVQLLQIADSESPVGKDAVPQLSITIDLFHKLAKSCEGSVDRIGQEFIDTTQYGGENKQVQDDIHVLLNNISGEVRSAQGALERAEESSQRCSDSLASAQSNLRDAQNKRDVSEPGISYDHLSCLLTPNLCGVGLVRHLLLLWRRRGHRRTSPSERAKCQYLPTRLGQCQKD